MTRILVIHGLGMNMRGKVDLDRFGPMKIEGYNQEIKKYASSVGVEVEIFGSNIEGEVINALYDAHDGGEVDAALINPAGYMVGHPALVTAIGQVRFPTFEIHVSNPASRGTVSQIATACRGVITGSGLYGYYLGLLAAKRAAEDGI